MWFKNLEIYGLSEAQEWPPPSGISSYSSAFKSA